MLPLVFSAQDWILLLRFPKQNGALLIAASIVAAIRLREIDVVMEEVVII